MPKPARILASVVTGLLLLGALGFAYLQQDAALKLARTQREEAETQVRYFEKVLSETRAELMEHELGVEEQQERMNVLERDIARLKQEKDSMTRSQQSLETEMRRVLESKDVTISELQGRLTVDILDRVLFDSGETTLKPEGQQVLRRVAEVLAQYPDRQVHVIGHTDNVPIRATPWSRYPSNWELSTARATAAVRFLSEHAGVDPRRLGAVGYGEFRPAADNGTAEGRARNRRIALVVLSDELVGSDAVPTARDTPPSADSDPPGSTPAAPPPAAPTHTIEPETTSPPATEGNPAPSEAPPPTSEPAPAPEPGPSSF